MNQYRVFVEKKEEFATEARSLMHDLNESLKLSLSNVRLINVYDLFDLTQEEVTIAKEHVLSEKVTDIVSETLDLTGKVAFAVEFLPGQYDQRADSAEQCLRLLSLDAQTAIKSGKIIILEGTSAAELDKIKAYYINPIEMREKDLNAPLAIDAETRPEAVEIYADFNDLDKAGLENFLNSHGMAMTLEDILFIQDYFKNEEKRNPSETELKVLDTYWSDHCRHTTFETIIKSVQFEEGRFQESLQTAFNTYLEMRENTNRTQKPMTLMDMATINVREERSLGRLDDVEVTDEINACSVYIDVDVDGVKEPWLLQFKNETHNHPTEIEPFGGASTCIGGAIRDPLSGRSYVYQAMRISGGANILESIEETRAGKLAQKLISKGSAHGNSSYGNQIGLATTFVREIYHEGYKAKHLETGAVVAAAPLKNVVRQAPKADDVIILLGGRTGRDGIGGATGSSKAHKEDSVKTASSEVQKGNAPTERKIQRLFREEKVTRLIKKCNDFGAGGVAVAIGELADGLHIDLDKVPVKYKGLNGTELAISESQERMAVVVDPADVETFINYAQEENLEAVVVSKVTDTNRLIMTWKGEEIVNLSRDFLNTNGAKQEIDIIVESDVAGNPFTQTPAGANFEEQFLNNLSQDNVASLKGMVEMFDATIGATSVLMPYGGKYQLTETEGSVHKLPVRHGVTNTASLLTYGYNPFISSWSPFHGAAYAVVESIAKIVALGGKWQGIRFSFQEYFKRLEKDPKRWAQPFSALLGAVQVQREFGLAAIGGKDSMSGSFEDLHVPPTLISFAVQVEMADRILSSEFKQSGNYIYLVKHEALSDLMPNVEQLKENFDFIYNNREHIQSAFTIKQGGLAEALAKMAFGNKIGVSVGTDEDLFAKSIGSIVIESTVQLEHPSAILLGKTTQMNELLINGTQISIDKAIATWENKFKEIYPVTTSENKETVETITYQPKSIQTLSDKGAPKVFLPVFPGTNSEYDTARAFERFGAQTNIAVFKNQTQQDIEASIAAYAKYIDEAQVLMLSGGFSAGDEPDGSGKFMTAVLMNEQIRESIEKLLARDGLIFGICNGFQALVKSGLLPYGEFGKLTENSPTLFRNNIDRHQSKIVRTRMTGATSPWLTLNQAGEIHNLAISHGEGKFVTNPDALAQLIEKGQIVTQYVDLAGTPTMDENFNPNGSSLAIEGIISPDGRILGKMGHSERVGDNVYKNVSGNYDQRIFESGVNYFK